MFQLLDVRRIEFVAREFVALFAQYGELRFGRLAKVIVWRRFGLGFWRTIRGGFFFSEIVDLGDHGIHPGAGRLGLGRHFVVRPLGHPLEKIQAFEHLIDGVVGGRQFAVLYGDEIILHGMSQLDDRIQIDDARRPFERMSRPH